MSITTKEAPIQEFVNKIEETLDSSKSISLYQLLIDKCPYTIQKINKKITGKNNYKTLYKERKWYTSIINYFVDEGILETERENNSTYHNVSDEYKKYFIIPKSSLFVLSNSNDHLKLYKQSADDFLIKVGLLTKDNKEFFQPKNKENKIDKFFNKNEKIIKKITYLGLIFTLLSLFLMLPKFDLFEITPLICCFLLLIIEILIITK